MVAQRIARADHPPGAGHLSEAGLKSEESSGGDGVRKLYADRSAAQVIAVAAFLFAVVFVVRAFEHDPVFGAHLFYIIPVLLLALRFGIRGGLIGATVAMALFVVWTLVDEDPIDLETWLSPAFTVFIVGALVGYLAESLTRSERRFRAAAENQLEPFALYSAVRDSSGEIVDFRNDFINRPGAQSVGMARDQMVGKLISELFPGRLEHGLMDEYRRVVETGEPLFREAIDFINVLGSEELVRAFDIRVSKLGDGIEITWRDITDKVRAERERDWLASIVESSGDAIMSADLNMRIVSWSPSAEQMYGYTSEEVVGKSVEILYGPNEQPLREERIARLYAGKRVGPVRALERRKDGSVFAVSYTAAPVLDSEGTLVGAARIVRELLPGETGETGETGEAGSAATATPG